MDERHPDAKVAWRSFITELSREQEAGGGKRESSVPQQDT